MRATCLYIKHSSGKVFQRKERGKKWVSRRKTARVELDNHRKIKTRRGKEHSNDQRNDQEVKSKKKTNTIK